jgi:hypothetical protein
LKIYEEYGPGKPLRELIKIPSSSIINGFLHFENASFALHNAISLSEFDWISSKVDLIKPSLIPNESRIILAS